MNSLQLEQVDGGLQVKQADFGSRFAYRLLDENGQTIEALNGQSATVRLVKGDTIYFEKKATVIDDSVAFNLDIVLKDMTYVLEILVGDYVFPSDNQTKLVVVRGAKRYAIEGMDKLVNLADLEARINHIVAKLVKEQVVYEQNEPSSTWTITHSLNKYPSVTIVDSGLNTVFGDIEYISPQKLTIRFAVPFSGKAILS